MVTATYDFNGVEEKHISFKSGTRIEVLEKQDEWWQGRINGQVGWFPSRYAEDPKPTPTPSEAISAPVTPPVTPKTPVTPIMPVNHKPAQVWRHEYGVGVSFTTDDTSVIV